MRCPYTPTSIRPSSAWYCRGITSACTQPRWSSWESGKDEQLFERAKGQVVEFLGYLDDTGRFARVSGLGGEERVARLAPTLTGTELQAPARLVLQRDDEQWAIDVIADERRESRFEVPVESVTTRLEDLAGLDSVLEPMIEDAILRLVKPEMMDRHGISLGAASS